MPAHLAKTVCLRNRISAMIENHPEILESSTFGILLDFPEFKYRDLNPTLSEVVRAFEAAVGMWKAQHRDLEKP